MYLCMHVKPIKEKYNLAPEYDIKTMVRYIHINLSFSEESSQRVLEK